MAAKKKEKEEKKEEKKESKEVSKKVEKLVDEISELSVMELSDLVNALQDKLGVSAIPVAAAPAAAGGANGEAGAADEGAGGDQQTVVLTGVGDSKIQVIKAIRTIDQGLGLKEAKDMTENLPAEILKDAKAEEAKDAADKLKEAGATVELK